MKQTLTFSPVQLATTLAMISFRVAFDLSIQEHMEPVQSHKRPSSSSWLPYSLVEAFFAYWALDFGSTLVPFLIVFDLGLTLSPFAEEEAFEEVEVVPEEALLLLGTPLAFAATLLLVITLAI